MSFDNENGSGGEVEISSDAPAVEQAPVEEAPAEAPAEEAAPEAPAEESAPVEPEAA